VNIPLLKNVYPFLTANELLGVQPLAAPSGFVYSLRSEYRPDKPQHYRDMLYQIDELKELITDSKDKLQKRRLKYELQKLKTTLKHHKARFPEEYV